MAVTIDEDEYSFPDDPDQNPQSATAAVKVNRVSAAPKKGKKGGAKVKKNNDIDDVAAVVVAADPEDDEESVNLVSSGKKKSSKSKKSCSAFSPLYSLEEEDVVVDDDRSEVVVNNHVDEEKDEELDFDFDFDFGKKKKSKKKGGSKFALEEEDGKSEITVNNHVEDEESKDLDFDFGTKKKGGKTAQEEEDLDKLLAELGEGPPPLAEAMPPPAVEELKEAELDSKKQKKKKKKTKSGRSAQEVDDLDKILAELGEGPASSSAPPPPIVEQPVQVQSEAAEAEENEREAGDAAKKKKEKENEKKKAAAKEEVPAKRKAVDNKKLPKHVREMQEAHALWKICEERKRVEEERLRREEEERLAELRRWRKKQIETVKLLKMKRNSRFFMDEQLAEYMMLAAIRRKVSGQNEVPAGDAPVEVKEQPKYESEKSKQKVLETEKPRENPQAVAEPEVEQAEEDVMNEEYQSQAGGVEDKVEAQQDQIGTPICIPLREFIDIGKIASIEINHKQAEVATKGQKVAIKIVGSNPEEQQKMFGRHFEMGDELVSHITRRSIDVLKADYSLIGVTCPLKSGCSLSS